jgi:alanine racemase
MPELKWIEIDLSAIRDNVKWALSRLDAGVSLMAVVKADAYGHGAVRVSQEALKLGASSLGVLTPDEGRRLRGAGIKAPIHLLAPVLPAQAAEIVRLGLTPTVDSAELARALDKAAPARGLGIQVDVDFGIGRWGVFPKKVPAFLAALKRYKRLKLQGLSAHIDYVPGKNAIEAEEKLSSFHRLGADAKKAFPGLRCHAANTSILLDFPHWQMDQVRLGNLIYGIHPRKARPAPLKRPWKFFARIIALHSVKRGESIGYASEYVAPRAMTVATVPVGYSDGLTMEPAERLIGFGSGFQYWGMLGDTKAPFIGRCGISHTLLDVSGVRGVKTGDAVALPVRRTAANPHIPRLYR